MTGTRHSDLHPPLGKPGGPCGVVQRIDQRVRDRFLKQDLIEEVESGDDLSNQEASKVYPVDYEHGVGAIRGLEITSHAQYRMDLRGVTLDMVRDLFTALLTLMNELKAKNDPTLDKILADFKSGRPIRWVGRNGLTVVFEVRGRIATIITVFWKDGHEVSPPRGGCPLPSRQARVVARYLGFPSRREARPPTSSR